MFANSHAGRTIEEGANWIHGVEKNNNPLLAIARAAKLKLFNASNYERVAARDSNGK